MRDAATVLGIIRERGSQGLPIADVYRQLFNPDVYLHAYAHLYANEGAMTPGTTGETVDAMSLEKIFELIDDLRHERFRWTPVKRIYIPKKNGKMRPLGLPTWTDKLLQDVIRMVLEAYYEPQFSDRSHGFRPGRGCHTALQEIQTVWTGTRWFIEGDIKGAFDNINHEVLLNILREHLQDNRFLRLIQYLLQAGYLEDWRYNATLSGSPQGGICSPILANISLNKLDQFVEQVLLPSYNRGERRSNREYWRLKMRADRSRAKGRMEEAKAWFRQAQQLPTFDPTDPDYRRLRYIRYADDTLLGFTGPKAEAEEIKRQLAEFLRDTLKLELSEEKTLITHAQSEAAHFLGYEIVTNQTNDKLGPRGQRIINGRIGLRVPASVVEKKTAEFMRDGKPQSRPILLHNDDFTIMSHYQAEYRGLIQYYLLAYNVFWFWKVHWAMQTSLLKTLAEKHQTRMMAMLRKYRATAETPYGLDPVLRRQQTW